MSDSILIVEVDGVPVRMRKDPPEPKPLVGACVVQDVPYVRESLLTAALARAEAAEQALADVLALDELACRHGTRLDIPAEIPGFDPGDGSDHLHFVLMPIGARSRRAAVEYLLNPESGAKGEEGMEGPVSRCSHDWKTQASGLSYCPKCGEWQR